MGLFRWTTSILALLFYLFSIVAAAFLRRRRITRLPIGKGRTEGVFGTTVLMRLPILEWSFLLTAVSVEFFWHFIFFGGVPFRSISAGTQLSFLRYPAGAVILAAIAFVLRPAAWPREISAKHSDELRSGKWPAIGVLRNFVFCTLIVFFLEILVLIFATNKGLLSIVPQYPL